MCPPTDNAAVRPLVLLVEDDVALGKALKFALMIDGYQVELMDQAETLLDRTFPEGPVCIVADLNLPGASGMEALEVLRGRGVTAPAILATTQPTPVLRARAAAAGVVILEKPFLGGVLTQAIRALSGA